MLIQYSNNIYWGLGIGGWGLGPNPQSPIPNPQSPKNNINNYIIYRNSK